MKRNNRVFHGLMPSYIERNAFFAFKWEFIRHDRTIHSSGNKTFIRLYLPRHGWKLLSRPIFRDFSPPHPLHARISPCGILFNFALRQSIMVIALRTIGYSKLKGGRDTNGWTERDQRFDEKKIKREISLFRSRLVSWIFMRPRNHHWYFGTRN